METNNPKTLVYLEDAFSLLEHERDCSSGSVDYEEGLTKAIQLVASLTPAKDLLSEELEGLPRQFFGCKLELLGSDADEKIWFIGYQIRDRKLSTKLRKAFNSKP